MTESAAPAGWYPVDDRTDRFWDGTVWTDQVRERVEEPAQVLAAATPMDSEQRRYQLSLAIADAVAHGARVESQTDHQVVLAAGKPVNHVLHLLITLFTCGLWAFVWVAIALTNKEARWTLFVDEYGRIHRR